MSKTANDVKQKWNSANYTQVKVAVDPTVAAAFKAACAAAGVSMAGTLSKFMADFCSMPRTGLIAQATSYATRKMRRDALSRMTSQLELLLLAEEAYRDNIPVNLKTSKWYDLADNSIANLQVALDSLSDVY